MPEIVGLAGECENCGSVALVQVAWYRRGSNAEERWLCRRCWRNGVSERLVITPQVAGKIRKRHGQLMAEIYGAQRVARERARREWNRAATTSTSWVDFDSYTGGVTLDELVQRAPPPLPTPAEDDVEF